MRKFFVLISIFFVPLPRAKGEIILCIGDSRLLCLHEIKSSKDGFFVDGGGTKLESNASNRTFISRSKSSQCFMGSSTGGKIVSFNFPSLKNSWNPSSVITNKSIHQR